MADAPPNDLIPVSKTAAAPEVPGGTDKPPADLVPVKKPDAAAAPPAEHSLGRQAIQPAMNILPDIWDDMKKGFETSKHAVSRAGKPGVAGFGTGLEALAGAAQVMGAPVTGAARALAGDPARATIPQDTVFGQMAANTIETAAAIFGPGAVGEVSTALSTAAKSSGPVKTLMDGGVQLTIGQISGKLGKRLEEASKSVPILGSFIRGAEARTMDSFNVATTNKALAHAGLSVDAKNGREAIDKGQDVLDAAYDAFKAKIPAVHQDSMFDADISRLQMKMGELGEDIQNRIDTIIRNRVSSAFGTIKAMDGVAFKKVDNELGQIARASRASEKQSERDFGTYVGEIRSALQDAVARQYPALGDEFRNLQMAYGLFGDVERAASRSAVSQSRFTPGSYLQSLKQADKSPRDRKFAAGKMRMQKWAEDAYEVIGNKLPDSGTAERAMWDVGGAGGLHFLDPTGAALPAIAGGSALYSGPGQAATNAAVRGAPGVSKAVRDLTAKSGPAAGVAESLDQRQ